MSFSVIANSQVVTFKNQKVTEIPFVLGSHTLLPQWKILHDGKIADFALLHCFALILQCGA